MMIYTVQSSKKTRKQKAKELAAWNEQQKKYGVKTESKKFAPMSSAQPPRLPIRAGADAFKAVASIKSMQIDTFQKTPLQYTGTNMIGIATMHKSNSVPVFSTEDAKDIAKMRRG